MVRFHRGSARLDQQLTQNGDLVKQAIDALSAGGSTNIAAGINTAQQELTSSRHNPAATPVIVLLSDGRPTIGDALAAAQSAKGAGAERHARRSLGISRGA